MLKSNYSRATFILIGLFFMINLFNINDYGIIWDEPFQRLVGQYNLEVVSSGFDNIKFPENLLYYGPFFEILNHFVSIFGFKILGLSYIATNHLLGLLFSVIGLIFLFLLCFKLFNEKIGFYSIFLLVLFPVFIAHSHYNPKDIPLMVLSIITIFFLYLAFTKKNYLYSILAGIFFGFSLSTLVTSLMILPIFFMPYSLYLFFDLRIFSKRDIDYINRDLYLIGVFILSSLFFMFVSWPALWHNPLLFFDSILNFLNHDWSKFSVLYNGITYSASSVPWHYSIFFLFISMPIFTLIFFFFGLYYIKKNFKNKFFEYSLLLSWFFIPLFVQFIPGTLKYDGFRHLFILLPPLIIISSIGLFFLIKSFFEKYQFLVLLIIFIVIFSQLFSVHPYESSYVSEGFRLFSDDNIEKSFEIEYWGSTYLEAINWLNINAKQDSVVCVLIANDLVKFYDVRKDISFGCENADYYMYFTRYAFLSNVNGVSGDIIFKISRYDSDLLYILGAN